MSKNFEFIYGEKTIVCKGEYRGKTYYGRAKCHPADVFDQKIGESLAKIRLLQKISKARLKVALAEVVFAEHDLREQIASAHAYYADAQRKAQNIDSEMKELESKIYGTEGEE